MNLIHRLYCRSRPWRAHVRALLPWALDGISLERAAVLELGPGPGLTTDWLVSRVGSLTCLEYDEADASALARGHPGVVVRRGDATALPFESGSFDAVVCFTMLHHLPSAAAQDRLCAEAARVLRPSGLFAGSDSRWGPLFALAHVGDTCTLVDPEALPARLEVAGFDHVEIDTRRDAFRFRAHVD
ncbi:SAM-dependent methyltransferase [Nocardioides salarius]|uniref:SAM-dependent methyltransferase n=1 Tax=Nocardioides salarius TaxID=374513 RepID=A0ABS2MEH3_9ACTN|nr:class I SAM-dependent methyltransferase [Nocardioides salarius]MBM7509593.1 SAM-dependent methyltransferase [Nocardioides salarius]